MTCWRSLCLQSARSVIQPICRRWILTFQASSFPEIFNQDTTITDSAFAGDPLCQLSAPKRGILIQRLLEESCQAFSPSVLCKHSQLLHGLCVNGQRHWRHQSEFDWSVNGRRVECKSTRLAWQSSHRVWKARWQAIKFAYVGSRRKCPFDDLILVLHSPFRLDIMLHDLSAGISHRGLSTAIFGHNVACSAPAGTVDVETARQQIVDKLCLFPNAGRHIASWRTDSDPVKRAVRQELVKTSHLHSWDCYETAPLAELSGPLRGLRLQDLAYKIDQILHPNSMFTIGPGAETFIGQRMLQKRGTPRSSADWCRDGCRVEFKSSKVHWNAHNQRYYLRFSYVKDAKHTLDALSPFDELLLGIYSPSAFFLVRHAGNFAKSRDGQATCFRGCAIDLAGPKHVADVSVALDCLLAKFQSVGCHVLARVEW